MGVLSRLPRNDLLLLAAGVAIIAAAVAVAVLLASTDGAASARPAATVQVIPLPREANGNQALPNSTRCSIGGKCRDFSFLETADMATNGEAAKEALRDTWGGSFGAEWISSGFLVSLQGLTPQVQAAAASYLLSRYCIRLRFPDPKNAWFVTAGPYGPRGRNGC